MPSFDSITSWSWILGISGRVQGSRDSSEEVHGEDQTIEEVRVLESQACAKSGIQTHTVSYQRCWGEGGGGGNLEEGSPYKRCGFWKVSLSVASLIAM